ncbi:Inner membrane protein YecN [Methylobacterium cerastii]|uniref:Inner membrane protein YecN n=1 Tax=Methylobacterium cerastii TaxID=932741 RepID=A0ABQ4QFT1_9HYPH|nr:MULTISPECIES: MAPEG family protein [Methylobacterium]TXN07613.1 glutathione S-transferase [Methylobacterium sp. WL122]TXN82996.1 glutathione S-transferase [Methylobacterium sp. WL8]GJD43762.1 Inner membrane protein YecN [Methylobacterium cerastii]
MIFPATTALFAGLLGLLFIGLSAWVMGGRVRGNVLLGDGGKDTLQRRIRSHGNFSEYVPMALGLVALLEAGGTRHWIVVPLLTILLVARLLHPVGMLAPENSPRQFTCRGGGIIATLLVTLVAAILLIIHAI